MKSIYDYPITVNENDIKNYTGIDLSKELDGTDNVRKVKRFLNNLHRVIYDDLIYSVGGKAIKEKIIETYENDLSNDIKKALITQAEYMIDSGDISLWNGAVVGANGTVNIADSKVINQKLVSPAVINILRATTPNILYMGE